MNRQSPNNIVKSSNSYVFSPISRKPSTIILAGLLTYSIFERSFPFIDEQWMYLLFKDFCGEYSSGSAQDSHLIPF